MQSGREYGIIKYFWELPDYKKQLEFCSILVENSDCSLLRSIFDVVVKEWGKIPYNRKDKFYALLGAIVDRISVDVFAIQDTDLRNYLISKKRIDERAIDYIAVCEYPSTLSVIDKNIGYVDEHIGRYAFLRGRDRTVGAENRRVLYKMYEASFKNRI